MFLIHYGWRGTIGHQRDFVYEKSFLIHYGWRGTTRLTLKLYHRFQFLIHYGWRGTRKPGRNVGSRQGF